MAKIGAMYMIPNSRCPFEVSVGDDKKTAILTVSQARIGFALVIPHDLAERLIKECGFEKVRDVTR
jgi:hypothetical protein